MPKTTRVARCWLAASCWAVRVAAGDGAVEVSEEGADEGAAEGPEEGVVGGMMPGNDGVPSEVGLAIVIGKTWM